MGKKKSGSNAVTRVTKKGYVGTGDIENVVVPDDDDTIRTEPCRQKLMAKGIFPNSTVMNHSNIDIKMRICLGGCNKKFQSKGKGNRICKKCRTKVSHSLPEMSILNTREDGRSSRKVYIEGNMSSGGFAFCRTAEHI